MANPYSKPTRYKYQPVNVGMLAQPLAQKQAAYDQQTALIDNASFDIKALDSDSEVVKKKKEALQASLDEMSKDLLNTKDFRSASRKLAKLNKFYTTSDEIQSHQQNYAGYQKHKADLQKRVNKGDISQGKADLALRVSLGEFDKKGGTGYDPQTGEYNTIALANVSNNMDKEISEFANKMAKANKKDSVEHLKFLKEMGITGKDKDRLITIAMSGNSAEEIRKETLAALQNSDRFKEYLENQADLEVRASRLNPNFTTDIYDKSLAGVNEKITNLEEAAAKKEAANTLTDEDKKYVEKTLANYKSYKANLENNYKANPESTENNLLKDNAMHNRLANEAAAMGDIYAFDEIDYAVFGGKGSSSSSSNSSFEDVRIMEKGFGPNPVINLSENINASQDRIAVTASETFDEEANPISYSLLDNLINPAGHNNSSTDPRKITNNNLSTFSENPELYTGQMNHVLQAFDNNKDNLENFKQDLKSYGVELTDEYANSLFTEFQNNPTMLDTLDKTVTSLGKETINLSTLKEYKKVMTEQYIKDKDTQEFMYEVEKTDAYDMLELFFTEDDDPLGTGHPAKNTVFDQEVWGESSILGNETYNSLISTNLPLTFAEVAKKAGYSSVEDAIAKGYDWQTLPDGTKVDAAKFKTNDKFKYSGDELESSGEKAVKGKTDPKYIKTTAEVFDRHKQFVVEEDPKKYNKETIINSYSGDAKLEKSFENIFGGPDDVIEMLTPIFEEDWENVPGFGDASKPGGLAGITLKNGGNFTPAMIGDKLMFEVDYIYKDDKGDENIGSVFVDFAGNNESSNVLKEDVIQSIINNADTSTKNGVLVSDAANRMKFDNVYKHNTLNSIYVNAIEVAEGGSVILDKMSVAGPGKSGQQMATVIEKNTNGDKVIRLKTIGGNTEGYIRDVATNRPLEFKTAEEAKTYLAYTFLGETQGRGDLSIKTYIQ